MAAKKRFLLRIDPDLYRIVEKWAADEFRSVNAQMEFLLKEAVRRARRTGPAAKPAGEGENEANRGSAG